MIIFLCVFEAPSGVVCWWSYTWEILHHDPWSVPHRRQRSRKTHKLLQRLNIQSQKEKNIHFGFMKIKFYECITFYRLALTPYRLTQVLCLKWPIGSFNCMTNSITANAYFQLIIVPCKSLSGYLLNSKVLCTTDDEILFPTHQAMLNNIFKNIYLSILL